MDIAGHWKGHYVHDLVGKPDPTPEDLAELTIPFEAWFELDGPVLTGRMTDLRPEMEMMYSEMIANRIEAMKLLDQMKANSHVNKHPECTYRVTLFPESTVKGRAMGNDVLFFKTHTGPCDFAFCYGSYEQITRYNEMEFHYHGRVSEDGNLIAGTFRYPSSKTSQERQTFELRRVDEAASRTETHTEPALSAEEEIPSAGTR